jgi:hypothetical protein
MGNKNYNDKPMEKNTKCETWTLVKQQYEE